MKIDRPPAEEQHPGNGQKQRDEDGGMLEHQRRHKQFRSHRQGHALPKAHREQLPRHVALFHQFERPAPSAAA
jgi:hypothetical protein